MILDLATLTPSRIYHAMTQTLIPRPIAWILTENAWQGFNLAPFSFFTGISSDPPILMVSIGRKSDKTPKDTWANIAERSAFVVHIPHMQQLDGVNESALELPPEISEVTRLGLELTDFPGSPLPRLQACRVAFACERHQIIPMGQQTLIFGRIHAIHIHDSLVDEDDKGRLRVHANRMDPASRLGGEMYASLGSTICLSRQKA